MIKTISSTFTYVRVSLLAGRSWETKCQYSGALINGKYDEYNKYRLLLYDIHFCVIYCTFNCIVTIFAQLYVHEKHNVKLCLFVFIELLSLWGVFFFLK